MFSYTTKVVWLGNVADNLDIGDLPILAADMRAAFNYSRMRSALRRYQLQIFSWKPTPGSGLSLAYKLARLNGRVLTVEVLLAAVSAVLFYGPAFFMRRLISYLESDPHRENTGWGWVYVLGLFISDAIMYLGACLGPAYDLQTHYSPPSSVTYQLWSITNSTLRVRLRIQLNTTLFAKTLVRKDIASSVAGSGAPKDSESAAAQDADKKEKSDEEEKEFSSKAQVMTLMTTDVDRVSQFAWHLAALVDSPIEIAIGAIMLYNLLGEPLLSSSHKRESFLLFIYQVSPASMA
jgi:hypothetical protein